MLCPEFRFSLHLPGQTLGRECQCSTDNPPVCDHADFCALQAIPMLVSVLVSGQQARMGNPGPVFLEQQHTSEVHIPFPPQVSASPFVGRCVSLKAFS